MHACTGRLKGAQVSADAALRRLMRRAGAAWAAAACRSDAWNLAQVKMVQENNLKEVTGGRTIRS